MKKYVVVRKIDKVVVVSGSRGLQKTDLHDLQLVARRCDVYRPNITSKASSRGAKPVGL